MGDGTGLAEALLGLTGDPGPPRGTAPHLRLGFGLSRRPRS